MGPMFRYERPQKGRYRQFHQLDVEVFGLHDPAVDAEVIDLAWSLVEALGIPQAELVINSVGCANCRPRFQEALLEGARRRPAEALSATASGARQTNPLRIYDCKVPADQPIIDRLPHSVDYLCESCATHFAGVQRAPGRRGTFRGGCRTGWCAASTTTRARRSRCWGRRSARRTRCSVAAATTGS